MTRPLPTDDPRRDRMLADLLSTLDAHHYSRRRRRLVLRAGGGVCVLALLFVAARWAATPHAAPRPGRPVGVAERGAEPMIERVGTRDVLREVAVTQKSTTLVEFIDDEQLLAALNRERPCYGLMRTAGRVAVLDRCVR